MKHDEFFIPVDVLTQPTSGECIADHYWYVDDQGRALFYVGYPNPKPMCNRDVRVFDYMQAHNTHWAKFECKHIPVVFMDHAVKRNEQIVKARKAARAA